MMRLMLRLEALTHNLLDYNYNYFIQGMIYENLAKADSDLAARLHHSIGPKFFVFSELRFSNRRFNQEGITIRQGDNANLFVSSPKEDFVFALLKGILRSGNQIKIGAINWEVHEARILKPKYSRIFRTLSPISVSIREKGKIKDLSPSDERFYIQLAHNLEKKYQLFFGKEQSNIYFIHDNVVSTKPKRIKVKNTYHKAYHIVGLEMVAPSDVLWLAYEAGIGERNSMGFGMIEGWEGE